MVCPSLAMRRTVSRSSAVAPVVTTGGPHNNALHQTKRGGAPASQAVVEARFAGERECYPGSRTRGLLLRLATLVLLASLSSCSKETEYPVDGIWGAPSPYGGHFARLYLILNSDGGSIVGTACWTDSGHIIYKARVQGRYPRVEFEVTRDSFVECPGCKPGERFSGQILENQSIVGFLPDSGRIVFWRDSFVDPGCL